MKNDKISVKDISAKKSNGEMIKMLTAYDYPMARLVDLSGVDMILVGDSLANVVLGLDSTKDVGMTEMLHHAKAVSRGVQRALIIGDMPYGSYEHDLGEAVSHAKMFVDHAGCDAVKLEWCHQGLEITRAIVEAGIQVMGHVGLTPQTATKFKVQGKDAQSARAIIDQAKGLEEHGCFCVVLECIPAEIAQIITDQLRIPTIGIGAGRFCDGQVLVTHDLLGLYDRFQPKFAKRYDNFGEKILKCLKDYCKDVDQRSFPSDAQSFFIQPDQLDLLEDIK